jgi:hypothetical protein
VTLDEIRTTLFTAAKLRIPRFDERDTTGMRIEKLEDYLLTAAVTSGELEEGRLYCYQALHDYERQWRDAPGLGDPPAEPQGHRAYTQTQIVEAKRLAAPDLYENIAEMKFLSAPQRADPPAAQDGRRPGGVEDLHS